MRAKKSLGQNFLKSKKAIVDIINAGNIQKGDNILEIGPGTGILTKALLETGAKITAIEKDRELVPLLKEKFNKEIASGQLVIQEGDILLYDPINILPLSIPAKEGYKVIANIPYYITGALFKKFLETKNQPQILVFLIQKEVAERIVARDGKESILSISIKVYGTPKRIANVPKEHFSPKPKVDSAIIAINNISKSNFGKIDEKKFFEILHSGFAHKRKMLIGNLKDSLDKDTVYLKNIFIELGIPEKARAEEISPSLWLKLAEKLT